MTIHEKIQMALKMARALEGMPYTPEGYRDIRLQAAQLKKQAQGIVAAARRLEVSNCAHVPDAGHRYFEERMADGSRKFRKEYRCSKCGKAAVKVEEVLEQAEEV